MIQESSGWKPKLGATHLKGASAGQVWVENRSHMRFNRLGPGYARKYPGVENQ